MIMENIKFDCRYFDGSRPCNFKTTCAKCDFYSPMGKRILIIKLDSIGDVVRTTVLLSALKNKYPDSHITWLVRQPAKELLELNDRIDRILAYSLESALLLQVEKFDLVISLDKTIESTSIAALVKASEKCGYGLDEKGKIYPFNKEAEYSFVLGLDNDLKFYKNRKTYQETIFEAARLKYNGERYELRLAQKELDFADNFFKNNGLNKDNIVVGINTGAGRTFVNKCLKPERTVKLIKLISNEIDAKILLLGGPLEKAINEYIIKSTDYTMIDGGYKNSLREFSALVNKCSLVITADTLALHIAIALRKPVIALFGPTCHQEIDLYGCGQKIVADMKCAPCYKNECDKLPNCMDDIKLEKIMESIKNFIPANTASNA